MSIPKFIINNKTWYVSILATPFLQVQQLCLRKAPYGGAVILALAHLSERRQNRPTATMF